MLTQTQFIMLLSKLGHPERGPKPPALKLRKMPLYWATFLLKAVESKTHKKVRHKGQAITGPKLENKIISGELCTAIWQEMHWMMCHRSVCRIVLTWIINLIPANNSLLSVFWGGKNTALLSKIKAIWVKSAIRDVMGENTNSPLKLISGSVKIH